MAIFEQQLSIRSIIDNKLIDARERDRERKGVREEYGCG
jgi:hypothetical protein